MNAILQGKGSQRTYIRAPLRRGAAAGPSALGLIWNQMTLTRHLVFFRGLRPLERRAGYTLALPVSGLKDGVHLNQLGELLSKAGTNDTALKSYIKACNLNGKLGCYQYALELEKKAKSDTDYLKIRDYFKESCISGNKKACPRWRHAIAKIKDLQTGKPNHKEE